MYTIRRNDYTPRVEMLPLIDVIFLLLTFFIYSLIMMVEAQVLPVTLTDIEQGKQTQQAVIQAITINRQGKLFFNREPVEKPQLRIKLRELAADPSSPTLYLAMEAEGEVDRGPAFVELIEEVRAAGINNFAIVGSPEKKPAVDPGQN